VRLRRLSSPSRESLPMPATTHLLYLHGFRSSPASAKATRVAQRHPQLPPSPRQAMDGVAALVAHWPRERMAVVGSSLGGFYASWVARQTGCKSVLLNPAVFPARDLARHIGAHTQWHQPEESFYFEAAFVDELRQLADEGTHAPGPELALIAQGDEVLDWREMRDRYPAAQQIILPGNDHAISDFALHLDAVLAFLELV
jgi:predicted esterase YcpF (UPF0227 family)